MCGLNSTNTTTSVFTEIYDYKAWIDNVIADNATPAYEVKLVNGSRTLINNNAAAQASSGDSGGSFSVNSLLSLLFVSFLVRLRRKGSVGKK
ncbi:hypothetical protein [Vibrio sp. LaRot3]|uniref:hypothetical protein n=1 Tax=Vibrio sp. LaRot3 TaxID=2998829 RepID=UPI0022CDE8DD|nr:hypothetical protein [Vibrio sp. LaRot3]MDA0148919.1 hypothetical protein [Vibrio sp. LaRot3]